MRHKHHIIPFHEWKAKIDPTVTRGSKEFNSPGNIVYLSTEQHAQAHQLLYELFHRQEDKVASMMLSGQMSITEARETIRVTRIREYQNRPEVKERQRLAASGNTHNRGREHSLQSKHNMSQGAKGKKHTTKGRANIVRTLTGRKLSNESKNKIRLARLAYWAARKVA